MRPIYKDIHPISKLSVVALVALVSMLVFFVVAAVLAIPFFGKDAFDQLIGANMVYSADNLALLKFFQIAQSVGLFIVPGLILASLFGEGIWRFLKLNKRPMIVGFVVAIFIVWVASPLVNQLGLWNMGMKLPPWMEGVESWMRSSEEAAAELTEMFVNVSTFKGLLFNIFMIGVIPAIGEEFLFRGVIQRVFQEWTKNKHVAVWVTAILFSALHLQFFGFIPRALLGALFGYLFVYSGNLWLPVLAHFINNSTAVIAYYYYNKGNLSINPDEIGTNREFGWMLAIVSLVLVVLMLKTIKTKTGVVQSEV